MTEPIGEDIVSRLREEAGRHPYPLMFATVSGAHLYGFASRDSDFDLRGCHVLPLPRVVGLDVSDETVESSRIEGGLEIDLVTHDVKKFFTLLLKKNGYVLEQLYSPLVVSSTPEHEELKAIAHECITRHHSHHYLGFAATQWSLFEKANPRRVKPLLYVYRVLLTGIHLMRSGRVEADLKTLNLDAKLTHVDDLIARKAGGGEKGELDSDDFDFHQGVYRRLRSGLEAAHLSSKLRESATARPALNDLLTRVRLQGFS